MHLVDWHKRTLAPVGGHLALACVMQVRLFDCLWHFLAVSKRAGCSKITHSQDANTGLLVKKTPKMTEDTFNPANLQIL
jgi:hypothetical protein